MRSATSRVTLLLGGASSGKSSLAERLVSTVRDADADRPDILYFATANAVATDDDLLERIARHQRRRGEGFRTIEAGAALVEALRSQPGDLPALIDSLGTWVAAHQDFAADANALCAAIAARQGPTVIVSDEVGLGVHPSTEEGRAFRDALGAVNRSVADIADEVFLVVAARLLPLVEPGTAFGSP